MADETKCPFCKAPRRSDGEFWKDEFECDTEEENVYVMVNEETTRHSTYKRSKYCYERQIDALQESLEAWRAYRHKMKQWDYLEGVRESVNLELQKLKNLGEIE